MPGTSRIVKLGDDMISLAGTPVTIEAPYLFEDSGINKIGDTYYYTYCSNWNTAGNAYGMTSGAIEYMTSNNPLGPYTYGVAVIGIPKFSLIFLTASGTSFRGFSSK